MSSPPFAINIIQQFFENVYTFFEICDKIFKTMKIQQYKHLKYNHFIVKTYHGSSSGVLTWFNSYILSVCIWLNIEGGLKMKFNKDTKIGEILQVAPEKAEVLMECGMHCIGCPASQMETLEEACAVHGIDVNEVVEKLNA